jgi:hypothetical protein
MRLPLRVPASEHLATRDAAHLADGSSGSVPDVQRLCQSGLEGRRDQRCNGRPLREADGQIRVVEEEVRGCGGVYREGNASEQGDHDSPPTCLASGQTLGIEIHEADDERNQEAGREADQAHASNLVTAGCGRRRQDPERGEVDRDRLGRDVGGDQPERVLRFAGAILSQLGHCCDAHWFRPPHRGRA